MVLSRSEQRIFRHGWRQDVSKLVQTEQIRACTLNVDIFTGKEELARARRDALIFAHYKQLDVGVPKVAIYNPNLVKMTINSSIW